MKYIFLLYVLLGLTVLNAQAFTVEEKLPDAVQEQRAKGLFAEIRCVVCDGQSVADSDADMARLLRKIIREQIAAGKSDDEVKLHITARYGDEILLAPPFRTNTYLLWLTPAFILLTGLAVIVIYLRRAGR